MKKCVLHKMIRIYIHTYYEGLPSDILDMFVLANDNLLWTLLNNVGVGVNVFLTGLLVAEADILVILLWLLHLLLDVLVIQSAGVFVGGGTISSSKGVTSEALVPLNFVSHSDDLAISS